MKPEYRIGRVLHRRGQAYEIVDHEWRETRDGRPYVLVRLKSHCADCGEPFRTAATRRQIHQCVSLNRRCDRHAKPGVPVRRLHRRARNGVVGIPATRRPRRSAAQVLARLDL
jgi:hypothetical protein